MWVWLWAIQLVFGGDFGSLWACAHPTKSGCMPACELHLCSTSHTELWDAGHQHLGPKVWTNGRSDLRKPSQSIEGSQAQLGAGVVPKT